MPLALTAKFVVLLVLKTIAQLKFILSCKKCVKQRGCVKASGFLFFQSFIEWRTTLHNEQQSGRHFTSWAPNFAEDVQSVIGTDQCLTLHEISKSWKKLCITTQDHFQQKFVQEGFYACFQISTKTWFCIAILGLPRMREMVYSIK